ncbi:diguanylate cyclase [Pseudomonas fluorescens]|uniref:GGDEF domain-containing protein n=1 Tax=unclassified Pseudomonas TaxID=196821 RepID=UPI00143DBC40|nr:MULTISPECIES: diguanylate cyclase [unclassified Pseudomonas]NKI49273.1 diguanylate cyclase [Pseudomonas fluorescens]MCF5507795.1 diguanylate cyclase [Pseudomonas sp. PA-3-6H]MCF5514142.1 diguanylate cyclase [Pseudomonas sp. PA-3-6E]MCF5561320.1 diguanylate cyclase [Pseudomonas sp. PA-3-5D]MCF5565715.1 diguanylate cyclase [Pseudomonas sp. PA-3-11C]
MSDDAQRWKEKYLQSIEQQDKLERRWAARLDLLRRGLVRSTLAAEGTDRAVDQCMKEMRDIVRTDDMDAALAALLPRLEKAVLDSEQRRETRVDQISAALTALVTQLQKLPLPREVARPLKTFAKQLDGRVAQAREIPLLLSELSSLQGQALNNLEPEGEPARPGPGLLQRLFGSKEAAGEALPVDAEPLPAAQLAPPKPAAPTPAPEPEEPAQSEELTQALRAFAPLSPTPVALKPAPVAAAGGQEVASDTPLFDAPELPSIAAPAQLSEPDVQAPPVAEPAQESALAAFIEPPPVPVETPDETTIGSLSLPPVLEGPEPDELQPDGTYALPDSPEPSYSSVAKHIEGTLLGLLEDLSLPERHQPQAEAMRERLAHGLNWYELLPILDDLAVLMLAVTDSGQHEFEAYLKQLNERLEAFQGHLQVASEGHADSSLAARELDTQIREQVDGLQSSVQDAADLDSLKQVLESHLEGLLGTMDEHQQQRDLREQEVAARLKGLAERVAHMEQEAQGYREHLEVQRQKALLDPLTGLPNRAAWSERLDYEVNAWHQRGNSLSLAMLDLDHFKRINDGYGHLAGDKVLKIIANVLSKRLRPTDFIARFGGEEFVLLMPDSALADALAVGEVLREAIAACPFHFKGEPVTITVSMGVAQFQPGERSDLALKRADEALYRAKAAGRNQVQAA